MARLVRVDAIFYKCLMSDLYTSWPAAIAFLKAQAKDAYVWDERLSYWAVKTRWHYWDSPPRIETSAAPRLKEAFAHAAAWHQNHPSLRHNFMMNVWAELSDPMQSRIASFFEENGLTDFDFLDHGGRGMVFHARDQKTGRTRIARLEADHSSRTRRLNHPSVLQAYHHNEDDLERYQRVKLEILPEIIPLHKMPGRRLVGKDEQQAYHIMTYFLAHGTNLTYSNHIYDYDASVENVGLLPDGKIVSLDPQFHYGEEGRFPRDIMNKSAEMQSLRPYVSQIYGMANDAGFF